MSLSAVITFCVAGVIFVAGIRLLIKKFTQPDFLKSIEQDIRIKYYAKAAEKLGKLLKKEPENHKAHYLLGSVYEKTNCPDKAISEYSAALKSCALETVAFETGIRTGLGACYMVTGAVNDAVGEYSILVNNGNADAEIFYKLGLCYNLINQPEKAVHNFKESLKLNNKNDTVHMALAKTSYESQYFQGAQSALSEAIKINPRNYEAHFLLGKLAVNQQKFTDAITHLKTGMRALSVKPQALLLTGECNLKIGNIEQAINDFQKGIALLLPGDASLAGAYYCLGLCFEKKKDFGQAVAAWEKASAIDITFDGLRGKLSQYQTVRSSDSGRKIMDLNPEQFQNESVIFLKKFGLVMHEMISADKEEICCIARAPDIVQGKFYRVLYKCIRRPEPLDEPYMRQIIEDIKTHNTVKSIILSAGGLKSEARKYMANRPIEHFGFDSLSLGKNE